MSCTDLLLKLSLGSAPEDLGLGRQLWPARGNGVAAGGFVWEVGRLGRSPVLPTGSGYKESWPPGAQRGMLGGLSLASCPHTGLMWQRIARTPWSPKTWCDSSPCALFLETPRDTLRWGSQKTGIPVDNERDPTIPMVRLRTDANKALT